jgi:hypothetical protein
LLSDGFETFRGISLCMSHLAGENSTFITFESSAIAGDIENSCTMFSECKEVQCRVSAAYNLGEALGSLANSAFPTRIPPLTVLLQQSYLPHYFLSVSQDSLHTPVVLILCDLVVSPSPSCLPTAYKCISWSEGRLSLRMGLNTVCPLNRSSHVDFNLRLLIILAPNSTHGTTVASKWKQRHEIPRVLNVLAHLALPFFYKYIKPLTSSRHKMDNRDFKLHVQPP